MTNGQTIGQRTAIYNAKKKNARDQWSRANGEKKTIGWAKVLTEDVNHKSFLEEQNK